MSTYFWNSGPVPPVQPPAPGGGGVNPGGGNPRWLGPPFRIGPNGQGLPPQYQAIQDAIFGGGAATQGHPAGTGVSFGPAPGGKLSFVPQGGGNGTFTGGGNGGPVGPPIEKPPWWDAFQQYVMNRYPGIANRFNWGGTDHTGPPLPPNPNYLGPPVQYPPNPTRGIY